VVGELGDVVGRRRRGAREPARDDRARRSVSRWRVLPSTFLRMRGLVEDDRVEVAGSKRSAIS
jgi:hypothetical protein